MGALMNAVRKIISLITIISSSVGLYFSILGWAKFFQHRGLFVIAIYSCCVGILIGIFEFIDTKRVRSPKPILGLLGASALILCGLYLMFLPSVPKLQKLVYLFVTLFFGLSIIKLIKRW
jgi:hypothetical protein